jgi:hypothetical protein
MGLARLVPGGAASLGLAMLILTTLARMNGIRQVNVTGLVAAAFTAVQDALGFIERHALFTRQGRTLPPRPMMKCTAVFTVRVSAIPASSMVTNVREPLNHLEV